MASIQPKTIIKGSEEEKQAYNKYVNNSGNDDIDVPNPIPPSSKGYDFADPVLTKSDQDDEKIQSSYKKLNIGDNVTYQGQGNWVVQFIVKEPNPNNQEQKIKEIYIQRDENRTPNISNGVYGKRERVTSMDNKLIVTENEMYDRNNRKPIIEKKKKNFLGFGGKRKSSKKKRNRKSKRNKKSKTRRRR